VDNEDAEAGDGLEPRRDREDPQEVRKDLVLDPLNDS